jgi:hypothetical protein
MGGSANRLPHTLTTSLSNYNVKGLISNRNESCLAETLYQMEEIPKLYLDLGTA